MRYIAYIDTYRISVHKDVKFETVICYIGIDRGVAFWAMSNPDMVKNYDDNRINALKNSIWQFKKKHDKVVYTQNRIHKSLGACLEVTFHSMQDILDYLSEVDIDIITSGLETIVKSGSIVEDDSEYIVGRITFDESLMDREDELTEYIETQLERIEACKVLKEMEGTNGTNSL